MAGFLADKGLRILRKGYNVIPIKPGEKSPDIKNWLTRPTTEKILNSWISNGRAGYGVGITTGAIHLLDIDVFESVVNRKLIEFVELHIGFAPIRIGYAPKCGLLFRSAAPFRKITSKMFTDPQGRNARVEILGEGQQFVAYAIHPDTHRPYRWIGNENPELTPAAELPLITEAECRAVVTEFERLAREAGWLVKSLDKTEQGTPGFVDDNDLGLNTEPLDDISEVQVRDYVMKIPNDDRFDAREDWLKIISAIAHQTGKSEEGREIALTWSEQHGSHNPALFDKAWNSLEKGGSRPVTFRYVIKLAKQFDTRITITVRAGELPALTSEAEQALIAFNAPLYTRGGMIVRPVVEDVDAYHGRRSKAARLIDVSINGVVDYMARSAKWQRYDVRAKKLVAADPPSQVAGILMSRDGEWNLPPLAAVLTTPTLRPDGSLLTEPGYDKSTRILLLQPPVMPVMPEKPTKRDAETALKRLKELLIEFPFRDEPGRSVALSGLITPIVRGALPVVPLHLVRAPEAGTGKSYIVDIASVVATGQLCPVMAAGRTEEETEKRLGACLMSGQAIISIDNTNGFLEGEFLCQAVERPVVLIRILGKSQEVRVESYATIYATGNNLHVRGDLVRRTIDCEMDANVERPELRQFKNNPVEMVLAQRGRYVADCLTIARAYIIAGRPDLLPKLASYESWSDLVRSALVWLGCADPVETMKSAREEDPEAATTMQIVTAWRDVIGLDNPKFVAELAVADAPAANDEEAPNLFQALATLGRNSDVLDNYRIGLWLRRNRGKIVNGLKIEGKKDSYTEHMKWQLTDKYDDL